MNWDLRRRLLLEKPLIPEGDWVWVHCASVGEFNTARPLIKHIRKRFKVFLTYFSPRAKTFLEGVSDLYDALFPLPLDLPFLVRKLEDLVRPRALILVEREIWVSLVRFTRAKKILISARSKGDLLERWVLKYFHLVVARTEEDARAFRSAGARKVVVCGNLKVAQEIEVKPVDLDIPDGCRVFIAGSTHPGEEEILVEAFLKVRNEVPLRLVIAPRHVSRTEEVASLLERKGLRWCRKSDPKEDWEVMVVDTLGELRSMYALADVTFVGGTLVPVGGHNLLEPALLGKPVIFGPYTHKVSDVADLILRGGYGFQAKDSRDIADLVLKLMKEGFSPGTDLREVSHEVRSCYLREVMSELE